MDSSSAPVLILPGPKRCSNRARTAGTNDEPPVRKTWSIAAGLSLARGQRLVDRAVDRRQLAGDPGSNSARSTSASMRDVAGLEGEARRGLRRQRLLQPRDRLVEPVAVFAVEELDQARDLLRLQRPCAPGRGCRSCRGSRASGPAGPSGRSSRSSGRESARCCRSRGRPSPCRAPATPGGRSAGSRRRRRRRRRRPGRAPWRTSTPRLRVKRTMEKSLVPPPKSPTSTVASASRPRAKKKAAATGS